MLVDQTKQESMRNLTVMLPVALIKKAKIFAAQHDTSLSQLVRQSLESLVREDEAYQRAQERARERLSQDQDRGTMRSRYPWTREDLHDR